jgi:hypothetical protein
MKEAEYKLIVKNHITSEEISYPIVGFYGKEKQEARLSEIDLFLLRGLGKGFKDKYDFLSTLNKLYGDISDFDDVFIRYENKGPRKTPALFGYNSILNYMAYIAEKSKAKKDKEIFLEDKIFKLIKTGFYNGIHDDHYFNIIENMKFGDTYLEAIQTLRLLEETYTQTENLDKEEAKKTLDKMLVNYKNLRKIILATKDYNKKYNSILGADPRQAEFELEKIKEMLVKEDTLYDVAKKYVEKNPVINNEEELYDLAKTYSKQDPDIIASVGINPFAGGVNPYDSYPLEDLPNILTKETDEESLEQYQGRQYVQQ